MRKNDKVKRRAAAEERVGHTRSVAELVPRVGRRVFRRFGFVESAVVARWGEIVGSALADMTSPDAIRFPQGKRSGGTLHLSAPGVHALSVQHAEPEILDRVNRYFGYGAVARIAIHQVAHPPRKERTPPRSVQPVSASPAEQDSELRQIGDDALRRSLETLAAQIGSTKGPPKIG
ncbi:DUF721 domain-containing protein [Pacificimonas flava]|uniref:Zn-ribbon-containing protein n=1 Tax=Pacificimonas flava TaxID=1234595 RepID=M2U957_9SPHN|nr:DciA family protein [Pacificimonas flava]EMD84523.1 Zn-ribbon-containing protein [Pacificimonas flava]MBB5279605.1 hypothetical protein [Pacificimonas flava]